MVGFPHHTAGKLRRWGPQGVGAGTSEAICV